MSANMSPSQRVLWSKLQAFTIGDPNASLGFAQRLARDNGWPLDFARRVIDEYRRFVFLAMEAGHPVTPSDEVDQAWHLHLVYTESYWHDLCRDLLSKPLHHGPTRGGRAEGEKFEDWYTRTLESYTRFFGHEPPRDIWPDAKRRFGLAPHFKRINAASNWIIPKPPFRAAARGLVAMVVIVGLFGSGVALASRSQSSVPVVLLVAAFVVILLISAIAGARHGKKGDGGSGCGILGSGCSSDSGSGCGSSGCSSGCGGSGCGGGGCGGS